MGIVEEIRNDPEKGARRLEADYRAGLTTLAERLCHDPGDAAELVNRTFAEVIANIDSYAEQSAFFAWMSKILVNLHSKDGRRRSNDDIVFPGEVPDCQDENAQAAIYANLDASLLRDAIETLPHDIRETLMLHYFMDMPVSRVARILCVPGGTVKSRLHYARQILAVKLGAIARKPGAKALLVALALTALTAFSLTIAPFFREGGRPAGTGGSAADAPSALQQQAGNGEGGAASAETRQGDASSSAADGDAESMTAIDGYRLLSTAIETLFQTPTLKEATMKSTSVFAASAAIALATAPAYGTLETLDSSQFEYKYEMIKLPTAENLDGSSANDFSGNGAWCSLGSGADVGTVFMNVNGSQNFTSDKDAGTAGDGWHNLGATSDTGYTIETRLKVTECSGTDGAILLNASYGVINHNSWLQFYGDKITWGSNVLTNMDTSVWHTYRLVRLSGENTYHVYVDGVLVNGSLGNGFGYSSALNRLIFGGGGGAYGGKAQVAYLRFCKGAYAPPDPNDKSRRKASTDFPAKYEMDASDARISTSADASDWTISGQSGVTISKNGILSVVPPSGKQPYWRTTDTVWKNLVTADTAFTVDFSAKINSCTISGGDRTLQFWVASPRATGNLIVGMNHVCWQVSTAMGDNILLDSSDNSDGKHVFRVAYDGATRHGFSVWRDGVKIGENLVDLTNYNGANFSFVRFGVPGSTSGGAFDIDYIRWTTDGAWDWKDPPKPFTIVIR